MDRRATALALYTTGAFVGSALAYLGGGYLREYFDWRTAFFLVGLPGIPALGVCFGNVLTVLSAKEKKAVGAHSWGRTLWHEFAHVATLSVTGNRISRWFSEGLSVYEETRGRKSWQRE